MVSVSAGYKHREIAIGTKKKETNKQHSQQRKPKNKFLLFLFFLYEQNEKNIYYL
jgi:hypothetical protein